MASIAVAPLLFFDVAIIAGLTGDVKDGKKFSPHNSVREL
jgi:hypothetical protein